MSFNAKPDPREELDRLGHAVRTAMNSVMGVTGLLAATPLDPEQTEFLNSIRAGSDEVQALIERLIALSSGTLAPSRPLRGIGHSWGLEVHTGEDAGPPPSGRKILLVEDNLINRRVITRLLQKLGHDVQTATNGQEALDAVVADEFDLVFMDIQMPVMDGLESTRQIRTRVDSRRQPWIVALTAAVLPEDQAACSRAGADDYLGKPVRTEDLEASIERSILGVRRAA